MTQQMIDQQAMQSKYANIQRLQISSKINLDLIKTAESMGVRDIAGIFRHDPPPMPPLEIPYGSAY